MKQYSNKQAKQCAIQDMKKEGIKAEFLFNNEKKLRMILMTRIIISIL